jgi:hypothetical protein
MTSTDDSPTQEDTCTRFLGLAPYLRLSIDGHDLRPLAQEMLEQLAQNASDANLWMNLSTVMFGLEQREMGLSIQDQALSLIQRVFHRSATRPPTRFRLLMIMVPGDIAANTPLDCLLENTDIELIYYYTTPNAPLSQPIPEHDAVLVSLGYALEHQQLLNTLQDELSLWPRPVINAPRFIPHTERSVASALLQGIPGLLMPPTLTADRATLMGLAQATHTLSTHYPGWHYPIIVRPLGSHAGRDLEKIDTADALNDYLTRVDAQAFFISPFIDYQWADGLYRKFRIALVDGEPFICHMAISEHWMIHYLNAGMYDDAGKRAEEAAFMANFDVFVARHRTALSEIHERSGLDYVCFDGAETPDGQLLIFEIDHVMVVHAMDPIDLFPYKPAHIQLVQTAFEQMVARRVHAHTIAAGN